MGRTVGERAVRGKRSDGETENKSRMNQTGVNVDCWSLLISIYKMRMSPCAVAIARAKHDNGE